MPIRTVNIFTNASACTLTLKVEAQFWRMESRLSFFMIELMRPYEFLPITLGFIHLVIIEETKKKQVLFAENIARQFKVLLLSAQSKINVM